MKVAGGGDGTVEGCGETDCGETGCGGTGCGEAA